jgi:hypothetical protein
VHSDGDVESLVKFHSPSARPTVCVTGAGAGVDNAWEQKKLEARKMLENAARREAAVPSVQCTLCWAVLISQLMSSQLTFCTSESRRLNTQLGIERDHLSG